MTITPLRTARLALALPEPADAATYAALHGDPETMRHVAAPLSADAAARAFAATMAHNARTPPSRWTWMLRTHGDGGTIGVIGLVFDGDVGEIGAVLAADARNRGYVAEAIGALVAHAFAATPLVALRTRHAADHGAAAGLMKKLGFTRLPDGPAGEPLPCRWRRDRASTGSS